MNRLYVLLRAVVALALTIGVIAAVPWLLLKIAPLQPPGDLDAVKSALTQRDETGSLFISLLKVLAWSAWLAVALSILIEASAAIRGRQAPTLPALSSIGIQRVAAYLIASIALAATSATSANALTPLPVSLASAVTPATFPDTQVQQAPSATPLYSSPADEQEDGDRIHVVKPGENLWTIADEELGDGDRWPKLFKESKKVEQPEGIPALDDPRVIHPGQRLLVVHDSPAPTKDEKTLESQEDKEPEQAQPSAQPSSDDATPSPAIPEPKASLPAVVPPASTPTTSTPAPVSTQADEDDALVQTMLYSGLAASGLAALISLKRAIQQRKRRPGHRIRMPQTMSSSEWTSRTTGSPDDAVLLDQALRYLARNLADAGGALPRIQHATVGNGKIELALAAAQPASLPTAPFRPINELKWILDPAALPEDIQSDIPAPYPALVSFGLASQQTSVLVDLELSGIIGLTGSATNAIEVLTALTVELATSRWADHIDVLCVGLPTELPAALSSSRIQVATSASDALDTLQKHVRDVSDSLLECELSHARHARLDQVAEISWNPMVILSAHPFQKVEYDLLKSLYGHGGIGAAVLLDQPEVAPHDSIIMTTAPAVTVDVANMPPIVLQRVPTSTLAELIGDLTIANDVESVPDPYWHDVPPEPADLRAAMVSEEVDPPALTLLPGFPPDNQAPEIPEEAEGALSMAAPVEGSTEDPVPTLDPTAPYIRVLGRVDVIGRTIEAVEPGKRGPLVELAAFLALNESPSAEQVSRALGGPRGPWSASTRNSNISKLRAWFGSDASGQPYVPPQGSLRVYKLSEAVRTDWTDFQKLAKQGLAKLTKNEAAHVQKGEKDLVAAFDLVKGRPFASASPDRYIWAEFVRQEMISSIVDVAHVLAMHLVNTGRFSKAREVITKALDIEPGSEILYRAWMRAEHAAGNRQGIIDASERLVRTLYEIGLDMEPETADLLDSLLRQTIHNKSAVGSAKP